MESSSDLKSQLQQLTSSLVKIQKLSSQLPHSSDPLDNDSPSKKARLKRALKLQSSLMQVVSYVSPEQETIIKSLAPASLLRDLCSLPAHSQYYEELLEKTTDDLIECVDKQVDLFQRQSEPRLQTQVFIQEKPQVDHSLRKPQAAWINDIDNSYFPFIPKLSEKTNAIVPIPGEIQKWQEEKRASPLKFKHFDLSDHKLQDGQQSLPHPYEAEIEAWLQEAQQKQAGATTVEAQKYGALETTPFKLVQTEEELLVMAANLNTWTEIAVDLEHHSQRSFQGITCLMQISTRREDYVIDTLKLWRSLPVLHNVFSNPRVVKVFHGADSDVQWLQRDFGLYVVNLFDTGQAARLLQFKNFSLAYLLQSYCGVLADKKYQLADWRVRPLPEEMLKYAREDTHYLLFIYDCLRQELVNRSVMVAGGEGHLLGQAMRKSAMVAMKTYEKPTVKDYNYYLIISRNKTLQTVKQLSVLKVLLKWRDYIARLEDESPAYVVSNSILFQMGRDMPTTINELRDCCRNHVPLLVYKYQEMLISVIKQKLQKKTDQSKISKSIKIDSSGKSVPQQQVQAAPIQQPKSSPSPDLISLTQGKFSTFKVSTTAPSTTSKLFFAAGKPSKGSSKKLARTKAQLQTLGCFELFQSLLNSELAIPKQEADAPSKKKKKKSQQELQEEIRNEKLVELGKRSKRENQEDEEEDIVVRVEQQQVKSQENEDEKEEAEDYIPLSISERHGKKKGPRVSKGSSQPPASSQQKVAERSSKWQSVYEKAEKPIQEMIDKAQERQQSSNERKKKRGKGRGGKQGAEKKRKYFLGSKFTDAKAEK